MNMAGKGYMWLDGRFVKFEDARVNILTHSLQYGSGIFEGVRCYDTMNGPAVFRMHDHMKRFMNSAKIYGMPINFTQKQLEDAVCGTVSKNKLKSAYIRPFAFYNDVGIGFSTKGKTTSVAIAALEFGRLFGESKGLKCKVSSWQRINSAILPVEAKASGNYLNSIIASKEAQDSGYDEAILMSDSGKTVAEGPGENIFVVQDGEIITPPKSADILLGITRDSIIKLAASLGIKVHERNIRKEELYTSDEAFFTGTAAEIQAITSVDSRQVGNGRQGPVTGRLSDEYSKIVKGENKKFAGWLTPIG
jgi:branched-chain amino acid aminotransferase